MINIVEADLVTAVVTALTFGGNVGIGLGVGAGGGAISHWKKSSCPFRFFFASGGSYFWFKDWYANWGQFKDKERWPTVM